MFEPPASQNRYPFNIITGWGTKATYHAADYLFNTPIGIIVKDECLQYCSQIHHLSFEEQIHKLEAWLQVHLVGDILSR